MHITREAITTAIFTCIVVATLLVGGAVVHNRQLNTQLVAAVEAVQ